MQKMVKGKKCIVCKLHVGIDILTSGCLASYCDATWWWHKELHIFSVSRHEGHDSFL